MSDAGLEHLKAAWDELTAPGAGFAMEPVEVRGVPMRVFTNAPRDLRAMWELASLHGDKPYLVYEDEHYTYGEVALRVRALAHWMRATHGIGPGDRVAVAMRNYPEWVVSFWAVVCTGAAVVGMNAWWTPSEMAFALGDSQPKLLIADDERVARLAESGVDIPVVTVRAERTVPGAVTWDSIVGSALADPDRVPPGHPPAEIDPDDDVTIFYTSGTTGVPKGAQLTHRGSTNNIYGCMFMTLVNAVAERKAVEAGDKEAAPKGGRPDGRTVTIAPTPLFHVTACNILMQTNTMVGNTLVFMYRWDAGRALELIEREGVTNLSGVPTMVRELLAHPDWERRDTSTLRGLAGGGAPVQPDLVGKIDSALTGRGSPTTGYGLTETHGLVSSNTASAYLAKPASAGRIVPVLDAKLVDEVGVDLPPGPEVVGELCLRGPIIVKGYLNQPAATANAICDGWFHTGDIARIDDDGFLFLVDRAKDMVLRGGENVYSAEVEAAIYEHPAVAQAAVFGVPDERLGEAVAAVIVVQPGAALDEAGLNAFLHGRIAAYKVPSRMWFRADPLPQNANGKFLKRELKRQLTEVVE